MGNENISFLCKQCLNPDNSKQEMKVPIKEEVNNNRPEQIENNEYKEKKMVKLQMKNSSNKGFNFVKQEETKPKPKITINTNNIEEEVEKKKNNTDSKSTSFNADFRNKVRKQSVKQQEILKKTEQNSPTNYQDMYKERIKNKEIINILIVGAKEVGKSVYALKEKGGSFDTTHVPTLWEETQIKDYLYNSHRYKLKFVNLSINESKEVINKRYEETDIFLIMYDVTNKDTFEYAKKLYLEELKNFEIKFKDNKSNIFLIGNKVDLSTYRKVTSEEGDTFAKDNNINFFEISVKTGRNCILLMKNLVSLYDNSAFPSAEEE